MSSQQTVSKSIQLKGKGIHSGCDVVVTLLPAEENTGIIFIRTDLNGKEIPVSVETLSQTSRATLLQARDAKILTPEHLLAALYAMNISNCLIEIDSEEVPIMDGSSLPFLEAIKRGGVQKQNASWAPLNIMSPIILGNDQASIKCVPSEKFIISYELSYPDHFIGTQALKIEITEAGFADEIASARTYGFEHEIKDLLAQNLAKGGSIENAIVITDTGYMTKLRYPDELVRHKILDIIGDLSVIGRPIKGHFIANKSGHALNAQMVHELQKLIPQTQY